MAPGEKLNSCCPSGFKGAYERGLNRPMGRRGEDRIGEPDQLIGRLSHQASTGDAGVLSRQQLPQAADVDVDGGERRQVIGEASP
jgi:hypothetical protein